ncbi:MAG: hypothetical protein VB101_09565 [Rhodospirillaceae bacterium]|nr:hypothetical protein [Rhodospirillaceae bacterium]MEA4838518.1 hypothetical protein [Rhodospirillaceae bacterium]
MIVNFMKCIVIAGFLGVVSGCVNGVPIQPLHSSISTVVPSDRVKTAILKAGREREWAMTVTAPGVITGQFQTRDHVVVIRITYSGTDYTIDYVSSKNMNEKDGMIHKKYNSWIRSLDKEIQLNLADNRNS